MKENRIAIFPGSFDPFTIGHAAIVKRGLQLFDRIIIGIGVNKQKRMLSEAEKRVAIIKSYYSDEPRVGVESYNDLTIDFARRNGAQFILRGLRSVRDFEYERDMADMNRRLTGIETVLLFTEPPLAAISSSVVRDLIGHGYDVHKLVEGRDLILGGVKIPCEKGLLGHSDADVLTHAVMDALLGAAALGDIGRHFPDSDPAYKGADSLALARHVAALLAQQGWKPVNVDATILCQAPKLAPHIPAMAQNLAAALGLEPGAVSVKATTEEHLGFTGQGLGIAAHAVALLEKANV